MKYTARGGCRMAHRDIKHKIYNESLKDTLMVVYVNTTYHKLHYIDIDNS